jgi:hypothetical protein
MSASKTTTNRGRIPSTLSARPEASFSGGSALGDGAGPPREEESGRSAWRAFSGPWLRAQVRQLRDAPSLRRVVVCKRRAAYPKRGDFPTRGDKPVAVVASRSVARRVGVLPRPVWPTGSRTASVARGRLLRGSGIETLTRAQAPRRVARSIPRSGTRRFRLHVQALNGGRWTQAPVGSHSLARD